MNKIEIPVNNPKAAALMSLGSIIPLAVLAVVCLCATDQQGLRTFWPLILVMGLACSGAIVAVVIGIRFALRGKYEIEYDDNTLRIRTTGLRESEWKVFLWKDIAKIGLFKRTAVGIHGVMGVVCSGDAYFFGSELRFEDQLRLSEQMLKAWEQRRSQQSSEPYR